MCASCRTVACRRGCTISVGTKAQIRGPAGECFYVPGRPNQPLLLVGVGTGLSPLYGVLREAASKT